MRDNRRNFLKLTGLAGFSLLGSGIVKAADKTYGDKGFFSKGISQKQHFNMCGYAAPKISTVRVAVIGLGMRVSAHIRGLSKIEGVEIKAICDIVPEKAKKVLGLLENTGQNPEVYASGDLNEWKKVIDRKDIDLVYICTPWDLHTPMSLYSMEKGKHVAVEVPAALTVEDCWKLVETSERTKKHCMMLENCCYDFFELLTLNMARQGFFGEIVHTEGAYIHDLMDLNFSKEGYQDMWRLKENGRLNGSLYPTHGIGPVCQVMDINRGDKLEFLNSVSSEDFSMQARAKELAAKDSFYAPYAKMKFRGNMNTTTIKTFKGKTIMIQHDVSSPNVYSRIHKISGTKASALKYPLPGKISTSHKGWLSPEDVKLLEEKYQPEIVKKVGEMAKKIGGHGGMDTLMNWRLIDCLRNGLPLDQDVYDAALWSVIVPLSEESIKNRSNSVDIPDFTRGSWKTNMPVDITLEKGGTTQLKA